MPNQMNTSKPPPDAKRVDPIIEHYLGDNNAYRGTENHGVAHTNPWDDVDPYDGHEGEAHYEPATVAPEPIPVRIVHETGARELKEWLVKREYATGNSNRILSRDLARTSARIRNLGDKTIWVGPDSSVQVFTGYPIPTLTEFVFNGQTDIWAISEDGSQQSIAIMSEYTVRER